MPRVTEAVISTERPKRDSDPRAAPLGISSFKTMQAHQAIHAVIARRRLVSGAFGLVVAAVLVFGAAFAYVRSYPIAVGQQGLQTPAGLYHIQNKVVNPSWQVPFSS